MPPGIRRCTTAKNRCMKKPTLSEKTKGLWRLIRIGPVLSWSVSAVLLGLGLAIHTKGYRNLNYLNLAMLIVICMLFQGFTAHAFNDQEDWRSGTDRQSPGILSGGTKVIKLALLDMQDLSYIGITALALGTALGMYLVYYYGLIILLLLSIGIWAAVAYTVPPIRLAYRPLLGEWLTAWPAAAACTLGTYFILTGQLNRLVIAIAIVHSTFSVAWLMQHHLADIESDLGAKPPKLTTAALAALRYGLPAARYVPALYFLLLVGFSLLLGRWTDSIFFVSALLSSAGIYLALTTDVSRVPDITRRELGMIILSGVNTLILTIYFATA